MRNKFIITLLLFLFCNGIYAYKQNAYITNTYFCSNPVVIENFYQPDSIWNILKANNPSASGTIVLNLLVDKGTHTLEIDIINSQGKAFDWLKFNQIYATKDNYTYTLTGSFSGRFGAGGIFFKVFDIHN